MAKGVTIAQVAELAHVSPASVSMILNEREASRFSEETKRAVQAAAKMLGYRAKHAPRQKPVRILCPSVMNPYYATLIQSIQQEAHMTGYETALYATYWDAVMERRLVRSFQSEGASGVIFSMIPQRPELAEELSQLLPVVAIGDRRRELQVDTVDVNNLRASRLVARHLLSLGHKRIAYISTTLDAGHSARVLRLDGLRAVVAEAGDATIEVITTTVDAIQELCTPNIEHDVGYALAERCIREHPEITAIVAINDMVAYGVLDALAAHDKRVPEDYSVCGFDNIYPSQMARIGLTTVDHSIVELGHSAFRLLVSKIDGKESAQDALTSIEYKSRLLVRRTTGAPRDS